MQHDKRLDLGESVEKRFGFFNDLLAYLQGKFVYFFLRQALALCRYRHVDYNWGLGTKKVFMNVSTC